MAAAAADAFFVVNRDAAVLGFPDGIDRTGLGTGEGHLDDGMEGAGFGADAAVHADVAVDFGVSVFDMDGLFGAVRHTGARKAVAAEIGDRVVWLSRQAEQPSERIEMNGSGLRVLAGTSAA